MANDVFDPLTLPHDPYWPRAGNSFLPTQLGGGDNGGAGAAEAVGDTGAQAEDTADGQIYDIALYGLPVWKTSLSPTRADHTPQAVREALYRFCLQAEGLDLTGLRLADFGDIANPDPADEPAPALTEAIAQHTAHITGLTEKINRLARLSIALGGDNSATVPAAWGAYQANADAPAGLITIDAHLDLRDGICNGSPVRRLIEEAGIPGDRIVQIGIADFANSPYYRQRAADLGITVIGREHLEDTPLEQLAQEAVKLAGAGAVHVDIDVDAVDRAAAPACPASVPGGISAYQLRRLARLLAQQREVVSFDLTEVDATKDTPDQRTVRLTALTVLEIVAGYRQRR